MTLPGAAQAVPIYAQEYQVSCEKCHSVIPHLNEFGAAFLASGQRIPGVQPGAAFPLAVKLNLVDSSANQGSGPDGAGLPKAIVDEVEAFLAGGIGTRASYLVEQYLVDGGMPGKTRDAWISDRVNPWQARIPVYAQVGSFTLPLPVDPETFRESAQHYAVYDQSAGSNPFNFFDPKIGARVSVGDLGRGLSAQLFAGPGHDRQSGLPSTGTDTMGTLQDSLGLLTLTAYRYQGTRPTPYGPNDAFQRTGYGVVWNQWGRLTSETALQTGWDGVCVNAIQACSSSGGFTQLRYRINRRLFVLGRYEGTADSTGAFARDGVLLLGWGPTEHSRVTIEDVIQHVPQTTHTMNLQYTIAE
ncbi:hypothetical protein EPN52_04035 [bacterium]|nr:MAG: hypothetical protein EPN52_04035 [bacterium]